MYRSQDQVYLKESYEALKSTLPPDDLKIAWKAFLKQVYLEDLYLYFRTISPSPVDYYRGNILSQNVIVLDSFRSNDVILLTFIKSLISKLNLDYNNFYVTSFYKYSEMTEKQAADGLFREIDIIKPDQIFLFSASQLAQVEISKNKSTLTYVTDPNHVRFIEEIKLKKDPSNDELNLSNQYRTQIWANLRNLMRFQ